MKLLSFCLQKQYSRISEFLILDFMHFPAVSSPWKQKLSIRFISNGKFLFLWGGYSCGVHEVIIVLFTATVQQNFSK